MRYSKPLFSFKSSRSLFQGMTLSIVVLSFAACTLRARHKKDEDGLQGTPSSPKTILIDKDKTAKELTEAAEQLITPDTFMLADQVFTMALEKDPKDYKALFYKAFLKRYMTLRGILARVQPLVEDQGRPEDYQETLKRLEKTPQLKEFLLDGKPDIRDAFAAQTFLIEYVKAINFFREFLINNPDLELTLNVPQNTFKDGSGDTWTTSCSSSSPTPLWPLTKSLQSAAPLQFLCDQQHRQTYRLNSSDLLMLRQMAAGEILYFAPIASYSFAGLEEIKKIEGFEKLPSNSKTQILKKEADFLTLRRDGVMFLTGRIAQDFSAALRWYEKKQEDLCPSTVPTNPNEEPRKGFLFSKGLCLSTEKQSFDARDKFLSRLEQAITQAIPVELKTTHGKTKKTLFDPFVFGRKQKQDLKAFLPVKEVPCGKDVELPDPTLGGLFPKGDAGDFISVGDCKK